MKGKTRRSVVVLAVVAMIAALLAIPVAPAGAASTACDSAPSAGFTDLAGFTAETVNAVDCIAFYGITQGTSATTYGPNADVSRWQMALFLTRKLAAAGVTLPSGAPQGFTDIATFDAATQTAINQLAQLNITKGTSATTFDPNGIVNRWQMALFMIREVAAAGVALPSGASQGFTDIGALDAATQTAINQLAQLGISKGTSATTYGPDGSVNRWQMALFLARDLDVLGVAPKGLGNFVTSATTASNFYYYADAAACKLVKVTYKATDSFVVNGAAATELGFEAALNSAVNKKVQESGTTHILTTGVKVTSGVLAGLFAVQEPVSGNTLAVFPVNSKPFEFYVVDGTATTLTGLQNAASVGDTMTMSGGDGTTAAKATTYTLTNGSVSGTVVNPATITISNGCQVFNVGTPGVGDSITVDGLAAASLAGITAGDMLTYSYTALKGTWVMTNAAPTPITGKARAFYTAPTFSVALSGTSAVVLDTGDDGTGNPWGKITINGVLGTEADFIAALTPGDSITYQLPDAATLTTSSLALTSGSYVGAPAWRVSPNLQVFDFGTTGTLMEPIDYTATTAAGLSTGVGGVVKYSVNGSTPSAAQLGAFESAVDFGIASLGGSVSLAKVGVDLVWSVTTP